MRLINNNKGSALLGVIVVAVLINIVFVGMFFCISSTVKKSGHKRVSTNVLNIAEAGKEHFYAQLRSGNIKPISSSVTTYFTDYPFSKGTYTVQCSTAKKADSFWVRSRGVTAVSHRTIEVTAAWVPEVPGKFPKVRAAVTVRTNTMLNGNINIDGQDYDSLGNRVGDGIFGMSVGGVTVNWGSATIGGNGITPMSDKTIGSYRSMVMEEHAPYDSSLESPERFLGVGEHSLDKYKSATASAPFNSLQYVTENIKSFHFGVSSGILIVHNTTKTAELETNGGIFYGLIICDKLPKINGNLVVYGAIVVLTEQPVSIEGKGNANVFYSSDILSRIGKLCKNVQQKLQEVAWREVS